MTYREQEREKAIKIREKLFKDPGDGIFFGKKREFVLSEPANNLWAGIREDVIEYFRKNNISWWQSKDEPTGHLLSSQVACLNHLYFLRQRNEMVISILKYISPEFKQACLLEDGFVEFEVNGKQNYLSENQHTRGINSTSVDAMMVGEKEDGTRILIFIEWKYTEYYDGKPLVVSDSGVSRLEIYRPLLERNDCPIYCQNVEDLFYEPFYQLMRQTLLAWGMVNAGEYQTSDWLYIHVIPQGNMELREKNTSPKLKGNNMESAWKSVLKQPEKYIVMTPEEFISPVKGCKDTLLLINYLEKRYWT